MRNKLSAVIGGTLMLVSACSMAETDKKESGFDNAEVNNWVLTSIPQPMDEKVLIDTDPMTRSAAEVQLYGSFRITANKAKLASRVHVEFLPSSTNFTASERDMLQRFAMHANAGDRFAIVGYSGHMEGEVDDDRIGELANQRAQMAEQIIREANPQANTVVTASRNWAGDSHLSRRVDIFLVPGR